MENTLRRYDYTLCSTKEERNKLLIELKECGVMVQDIVMNEMDDDGDYDKYPVVSWDGELDGITVSKRAVLIDDRSQFTLEEFKKRAGILTNVWGSSSLTFHFK